MTVELKTLEELEAFEAGDGIVLYGATWCGPCKRFRPHFDKASEQVDVPFAVVYLDTLDGTTQDQQFAERNIMSVPTARYVKDGYVVDSLDTNQGFLGFAKDATALTEMS